MDRRLYRSRTDRMIWGVCGGLAKYFNIDPVLVRIIFVLLTLANGIGIVAYIIMAIVVPLEGSSAATPRETTRENIEEIKKSATDFSKDVRDTFARPAPPPEEEVASRHRNRNILGIVLILVGVIVLLASLNVLWWFRWSFFWPVILIVIGLLIIFTARRTG